VWDLERPATEGGVPLPAPLEIQGSREMRRKRETREECGGPEKVRLERAVGEKKPEPGSE